jgi:hypothetical protein
LTEHDAVKLVKKIMGEKEVESMLQRLDRLTLDEARTTAMQTLEVVYGLVQNMRVIMDGEATLSNLMLVWGLTSCLLDGKVSADAIWDALSMFSWREY